MPSPNERLSGSIAALVADLRHVVDRGVVETELQHRSVLLELAVVKRRSRDGGHLPTRTRVVADVLKDAVAALADSESRAVCRYVLGFPPHQAYSPTERKRRAAQAAGHSPEYFRKLLRRGAYLDDLAFKLLQWDDPEAEELDLGRRNDPGIARYFADFVEIGVWDDLFEASRTLDLVINYGATWRNTFLKQIRMLLEREGGQLRVVLPERSPNSPVVRLLAERHEITEMQFLGRVETAVIEFGSLRHYGNVEVYETSLAFQHSLYLFDTAGILALYALCGERVPTPAFLVREGSLLDFAKQDFARLLRASTPISLDDVNHGEPD